MKKVLLFVLVVFSVKAFGQTPDEMTGYFQSASQEFNVPQPILEAIGYIETHWSQYVADTTRGVMGLRNDSRFSYSLDSAAKLIGLPVDSLLSDPYQNIRGGAAYLSELRDQANKDSAAVTGDLSSWSGVIARYSGIPQEGIAIDFAYHTLQELQLGVNENGIVIPPESINLDNFPDSVKATGFDEVANPPVPVWVGSPNYNSRNGAPIVFVIIHDTEEQFDYAYSLFEDPSDQASAQYLIRSQDGYIDQFVQDSERAWAVSCWNSITLNIEHEGFVSDPTFYTETEYESSARLTASLCEKYNIPEDSLHIFGHNAWTYSWFNLIPFSLYTQYVGTGYATCNNHTDPGVYWNWHHYFDLIHSYDTTRAAVTGSTPAVGDTAVPAYSSITINFNKPMEPVSTESAFSITPPVPGHISFNAAETQLVFRPDTLLPWSATYTVRLDTSAKGTNLVPIAAPYEFEFTTVSPDTTGPSVIEASPSNNGNSISKAYVEFVLNEPVQLSSVPSRISFVDSTGKSVPFTKDILRVTSNGLTLIAIRSSVNLMPGMKYIVTLAPGLVDLYGVQSKVSYSTTFICDTAEASGGSVIEGFESSLGKWLQPSTISQTFGVDTSTSGFGIAYRGYDGYYAGMLRYQFDSTKAVCAEEDSQGFNISGASSVGMWIFGDDSRNELDFVFGTSPEKIVPVDTVDWYGWRYVGMWRDKSDASTSLFKGFAVKRLQSSLLDSSTIYVDDIQVDGRVTGIKSTIAGLPTSLELYQNYPNPFNPTTVITYQLPANSYVTLKVYDVLGREVETLADGPQIAGNHSVTFDASRLPSGVYFYRIVAGDYSLVKKMILMK